MDVHEGLSLPGAWVVKRYEAGARLRLERDAAPLRREVWRRLGILLIPVVLAGALGGGTWDAEETVKHIAWPVLGLLLLVVALALLSVVRAVLRAQRGVFLEVDAAAGTVTGHVQGKGLWSDSVAPPATLPLTAVRAVDLGRWAGHRAGEPTFASLALGLEQGRLEGPEGLLAADQLTSGTQALEAAASALGKLASVPVKKP